MKAVGKSLREIFEILPSGIINSKADDEARDVQILGVTADSNKCRSGFLFVAVRGAQLSSRNGHDFIEHAILNGAVAVVVDEQFSPTVNFGVPVFYARDSKRALSYLCEAFFDYPSRKIHIIGITGTNGKTSTTFMLHSILKAAGHNPKVMGTLGLGDPGHLEVLSHTTMDPEFLSARFAQMHEEGVTHVIMEVSSHALSLGRVEAIQFSAVGLTNITQDHLDFHETLKNYQEAKSRLFFELADENTAIVLPTDHPFGAMAHKLHRATYYSPHMAGISSRGLITTLGSPDDSVTLPFFGDFHAKNAALAIALARALKVSEPHIRQGLVSTTKIPGRLEIIDQGQPFSVMIDFAHTPHALSELLTTLRKLSPQRIIVVFGCGGDRDRLKRPIMGKIACDLADIIIVTDDNPRTEDPALIRRDVLSGASAVCDVHEIAGRSAAIEFAIRKAQKNDLVVIAGKGHENYQSYGKNSIHFSDQEEARKVLEDL